MILQFCFVFAENPSVGEFISKNRIGERRNQARLN